MASCSVRLYKINPRFNLLPLISKNGHADNILFSTKNSLSSTNAYEAHADGQPLGCVVMGCGLTYQLLIYNSQKVPQTQVSLSGGFTYNMSGLYVSFSDQLGIKRNLSANPKNSRVLE